MSTTEYIDKAEALKIQYRIGRVGTTQFSRVVDAMDIENIPPADVAPVIHAGGLITVAAGTPMRISVATADGLTDIRLRIDLTIARTAARKWMKARMKNERQDRPRKRNNEADGVYRTAHTEAQQDYIPQRTNSHRK